MSDETGTFRFDHDVVLREAANLESAGGSLRFLLDHHGEGLGDRDLGRCRRISSHRCGAVSRS